MSRERNMGLAAGGFIIGGLIGGIAAAVLTPQTGADTRHDINKYTRFARLRKRRLLSDARAQSKVLVSRAEEIMSKTRDFAEGKYKGSSENFEKEMKALKAGYNKAVETYKSYQKQLEPTENIVDEIFVNLDEENLPKQEGMGRRINN